ncbi:MAG: PKD domain-containing protein [Anaerolineae bacterium]|nr:PKD domain-containing protein [Anaerolineae bacterium]
MIGGAVLIFVESVASTSPTGSAFVICHNGRPVGTALQGYDKDSGLASLSVSCSPARTYDLSWTQPGRFYAGVVREVPPPGHTCTLTLTDRAGLSITQSLSGDICWNGQGPDSEPGNDHPDDNLSAADAPPAPSAALGAGPVGQFLALPEGARIPARVAILWRGAAHDLWWLLAQLGEPADLIGTDFDPIATAAQYPVLLIPSGGLYGMESSPAFRARLEEYARRGGTIVALAQQHGYEYGALPGGQVSGYGWTEDNSCFAASLYLSQWHPILSGFTQPTLDAHVDGYFTTLPEDARVLLSRTANGMPAAILYPYPSPSQRGAEGGSGGWVFATTIYDDWGTANGQSSADARTLLRDLLAWAIDDEGESEGGLPLFAPGSPITLTFPITNSTPYTATAVALRVVDPARQVVLTATLPITIAPGQSAAVHQTLPPTTTLGIWRVDASLLTASGYPLTANFQAIRFFLANPAEPVDLAPELSLSITAPAERFTLGTVTVFTFIARNRSAVTQTVELQYWLPHHTWKTRDPSYGDFHTPNRQTLSVPPYGEVRYRWPRAIRVGMDRLWARLVREGRGVAEAHFAVYGAPGTASVRAALDPSQVQRTGVTTLTVRASPSWESGPFTATFHIRAMDAAGTLFHTATLTAPVMGGWLLEPFTHPITLPASAAAGRGYVWAEARAPDGRIAGGAFAIFTVPPSPLAFSPVLLPLQGGTVVSPGLVVTNTSTALPVEHGTVTLTLTTPGQNVTPTASAPFTLAPASSSLLTLPLDLPPLAFGTYTLTVETADEYGERRADAPWPATVLVAGSLDRPFYRARDVARLDLTLVNPGPFLLPLTTTLQSPIADRQSPVVLAPYGTLTATWDVPIPANVEAGRYGLTLTLALPGGDALTRTLAVVEIPPASLDISVAPRSLLAGDVLSVTLANTGGADAAVTGTLRVVDARGQAVVSETVATAVPAGGEWRLALPLPPRMVGGFYTLRGRIVEGTTGAHHDLFVPLQVAGLEARLSVSTDRPEYLTTDVLTLTAVMTAGARSLEAGTLTWRVVQPAGVPRSLAPQFVTVTADLPFWVNALAVDDQGSLWIATNEGVRRLTSGEWRAYTPANSGLTGNDVRDVEIDPQGNVWFATWPFWDENAQQEVGGGVSVLLASGEWVTYTTTNSDLTSDYIREVEADLEGNVWFAAGPWLGRGVSVRLVSGNWFTYTTANSPLPTNRIAALTLDDYDNLWLVTPCFWDEQTGQEVGMRLLRRSPDGAWALYPLEDLLCASIRSLAVQRDGRVWMMADNYNWGRLMFTSIPDTGEWVTYTLSSLSGRIYDSPVDLMVDRMGDLWVAGSYSIVRYTGLERVLWQSTLPVDLEGNATRAETAALPAVWLGTTGQLFLEGELRNAPGQRLAVDRRPFTLYPADGLALSLAVLPPVAAPGAPVTLQGALRNGTPLTLTGQVVTLTLGGSTLASFGPADVPPGATWPFSTTARAPLAASSLWATATDGTRIARDRLTVSAPVLSVTLSAPDVVGREPFDLLVGLTNSSLMNLAVTVTMDSSDPQHATCNTQYIIPAGETRALAETFTITANTTFTVTITGSVTRTLVHTVTFGEAVTATFAPEPLYPEGPVAIPYTFTNTGQLPVQFTALVTASAQYTTRHVQIDVYLPVGEATSGNLLFYLPIGDYTLTYATPFETGHAAFRVAPAEAAELSATVGPRAGRLITLTAALTGSGFLPLDALLRLETAFLTGEWRVPVEPFTPQTVPLTLDLSGAPSGLHTATLTLLRGNGLPLASTGVTLTVPGADLVLTAIPTDTVVRAGEWVTLAFGVANRGSAPATAVLTVTVGDLLDRAQSLWLPGGEEGVLHFAFRAPDGLGVGDLLCTYEFAGQRYDLLLPMVGVELDVTAGWDAPVSTPGLTATLHLTVTNRGAAPTPPLYAHVNPPTNQPITRSFTIAPGETTVLDFAFPAVEGLLFYGIYEERERRGIYLNTTYLRTLHPDVTLVPDRAVYRPGDTVQVAVYAPVTGSLSVTAPGFTTTLRPDSCPAPPAPCFSFPLPLTLTRGTYTIDYALEGGPARSAPFDVNAPWVRVAEVRLLGLPDAPGDPVRADLTVASTDPVTVALHAWILYPDGTRDVQYTIRPPSLRAVLNNHLSFTLPLSTTQAGPHRLVYLLTDPADSERIYAAGSETFDVGKVALLGLRTNRGSYPDPTEPVEVEGVLYAARMTTARLLWQISGEAGEAPLSLMTGTQTFSFTLPLALRPGIYELRTTLSDGEVTGTLRTSFAYGTGAPDLVVSPPRLFAPSAGPTRTVELAVHNLGGFPASTTTVQLWDGTAGEGILLAELPVPALEAGETARIHFVWEIFGQGGPHTLQAVVDPADEVGEWHEENNEATAEIQLPSFALELALEPGVRIVGDRVRAAVRATNLRPDMAVPLTVTAALERAGWPPGFPQTVTLVLAPQAAQVLEFAWDTEDLQGGFCTVRVQGMDGKGERLQTAAGFWLYRPADFTAEPRTGPAPLRVVFTDLSFGPGPITAREWDFGDGSPVVTATHPVHTYTRPGAYTVTLTTTVGISTYVKSRVNYITVLSAPPDRHRLYLPLVMNSARE